MFSIEVKDQPLNWIAAIFDDVAAGEAYKSKLTAAGHENVELIAISVPNYPVYAIERTTKDDAGNDQNYFEYASEEGYLQLIREQKLQQVEDDWEVYFNAYIFEEAYFQDTLESSQMGAINHVHVDNYFLKRENAEESLSTSTISRFAAGWNLDGLDKLFDKYMAEGSPEKKEELAVAGYMSLFASMHYDFICGKLGDYGMDLILPMADKVSLLLGKKVWEMYSSVYMILLEDAIENHPDLVDKYFMEAENAINENMNADPDERQDGFDHLAKIYDSIAEYRHFSAGHWQKALAFIKESIAIAPAEGNWYFYLSLLYVPYDVRRTNRISDVREAEPGALYKQWERLRESELEQFKRLASSYVAETPAVFLKIALAFHRLREHLEWLKADMAIFPEADYLFWLNEAKEIKDHSTTRMELTEAAHFLHREGTRLSNIAIIEAAIFHYQWLIERVEAPAFEVHHLASALEDIAAIHLQNQELAKADEFLDKATTFYEEHLELVKSNPSVLMHYTEFLARSYHHQGNNKKPSLAYLNELVIRTEEEGEGMYSGPGLLRLRLALLENNEDEAVFHLTRLLLLHELCIDEEVKKLQQQLQNLPFTRLKSFIDETLSFMKVVEEGYYLDHTIKWETLKKMGFQEVKAAWEERKEVIRSREKI